MSLNLFKNSSTRENSGARGSEGNVEAIEGEDYKVLKDGNGIEHRILNLDNPKYCPDFGLVELEPMRVAWAKDKTGLRHSSNNSFKVIRDKKLDVLVGIPVGIDQKTKQILWKKIIIEDGEILDLSIRDQAMMWACFKRGPYYIDSPNFSGNTKCAYKAIDKEKAAETFLLNRRTKKKATEIAEDLVGTELEDYARNFGFDTKLLSPTALHVEVIKYAEAKSEEFMAVHNSDTRVELTVLNKAKSMGVVNEAFDTGITYNGICLGFSESEVLKYLKDHPTTMTSIDALSRRGEEVGDKSMGVVKAPLEADEANARIAKLEKELAAKEKALYDANEKALELQSDKDLTSIDSEFAELLKEAKQLDIKGAHNIRSKDKLKQKIAEKKALTKN